MVWVYSLVYILFIGIVSGILGFIGYYATRHLFKVSSISYLLGGFITVFIGFFCVFAFGFLIFFYGIILGLILYILLIFWKK